MNSTFLICGYPRSRTMWLSHFLTLPGESVCAHEATEYAGSAEEFWDNAERLAKTFQADIHGNADSANVFVLPALLAAKPLTRVVWIYRSIVDVAQSMKNAGIPTDEKALRNLVAMREMYRNLFDLEVDYHALTSPLTCKQLWDFCLPGVHFDWGRWAAFDKQRIGYSKQNPSPRKSFEKFLGWVKRELDETERIKT